MSEPLPDQAETDPPGQAAPLPLKQPISRFRAVIVHVLKSALLPVLAAKYLLFVLLSLTSPGIFAAAVLWFGTSLTVPIVAVRRSHSRIRRKFTVESSERCTLPSIIGFVLCGLISLFVDIAVISNSGANAGPLVLLAFAAGLFVFVYQSATTRRAFADESETETNPTERRPSLDGLVYIVSDIAVIIVVIAALIAMM